MPRTKPRESRKSEARRLKHLRTRLGLTQTELAAEFHCAQGAVAQWEAGDRTVPGPVLRLIEIYEAILVVPPVGETSKNDIVEEVRKAREKVTKRYTADPEAFHRNAADLAATLGLKRSPLKPVKIDISKLEKREDHHKPIAIRVILVRDPDSGDYAAEVPDLPGCITGGATREKALRMACDAIECCLNGADDINSKRLPPGALEEWVYLDWVTSAGQTLELSYLKPVAKLRSFDPKKRRKQRKHK